MSDYWYDHRSELSPDNICILDDGSVVKLDRRVPGDGTDWYVLDWTKSVYEESFYWSDNDSRIHPGDIKVVIKDLEEIFAKRYNDDKE